MLSLNVFLNIPNLGVFVVAEVALVLESLMLTINVPLQGSLVDGDKVTVLTSESDAPVDRLDVPEESTLGPGNEVALLTWKAPIHLS